MGASSSSSTSVSSGAGADSVGLGALVSSGTSSSAVSVGVAEMVAEAVAVAEGTVSETVAEGTSGSGAGVSSPAPQAGSASSRPWAPLQLPLVSTLPPCPSPLLMPLYSWQTILVTPQDPLMVASSPKLELIPTRSEVMPKARTFSTMTLRGDLDSLAVQSPQLRYSLPAFTMV